MNVKFPTDSDINGLRTLWQEAFGDTDEFLDLFFSNGFSPDRCLFVEDENNVVAMLYWFDCELCGRKIAYIYAVATAKSQRGKGLCHKLMDYTHSHLRRSGYTGAILVPGSASLFKFYDSMGYKTTCYIQEISCNAAKGKTELRKISKDEYAALRRNYLTENCVIQENENLRFLSSYATFYAGDGFIFAAYKYDSTLICSEILGDTSKAYEIVSTLGCEKGNFCTMGNTKPFAMYLPLNGEENIVPSYFGFAFD